jgi:ABC-2 type transport system ATP-binding protein
MISRVSIISADIFLNVLLSSSGLLRLLRLMRILRLIKGSSMQPIVEVTGIIKSYKSGFFNPRYTNALQGVDLSIREGELFGVLGPNGAGKTTLLNIIMGLITPDKGCVKISGNNTCGMFSHEVRNTMNMSSGNPNYPWALTVREALNFYGMLYGLWGKKLDTKVDYLIDLLDLSKHAKTRFDELSTGTKQRTSIAKSLLNEPKILLLDEPTTGMDPNISIKIRKVIKRLHTQMKITILLTTHYMREAEELCGRIAFIKDGKIAALGTKEKIKKMTSSKNMEEAFIELAAD